MNIEKHLLDFAKKAVRDEIEKAIDKVKLGMISAKPRTKLDNWWRRRFYIETARMAKYRQKMSLSSRQEQTIGGESE